MVYRNFTLGDLESIRKQLGMSRATLSRRSGVSEATVHRVLSGAAFGATFDSVRDIARALGAELDVAVDVCAVREKQARLRAERLVGEVQGTSGLEGQAVDSEVRERMIAQTVHELLAGSDRRLWGDK
jgi:transcriptional regulator with XRE-family HTH domain